VIVVGAGIGGLAAAVDLAARGLPVRLLERASTVGGKLRALDGVDAGPTVFTLRDVFDGLFADAGADLDAALDLVPLDTLARHAWPDGGRLDLFGDVERTADAIGGLSGARDADGYRRFARDSAEIFETLDATFMRAPLRGPLGLTRAVGLHRLGALWRTRPFGTLWGALRGYFRDPRLAQLFGRYATYCGASPFRAPATLMLIAHAERAGVWRLEGGMSRLAEALDTLARRLGVDVRTDTDVARIEVAGGRVAAVVDARGERHPCAAVVANADPGALADGRLGDAVRRAAPAPARDVRSLSAVVLTGRARTDGFPLAHHTVFFSADYAAEFDTLTRARRVPRDPTVYVCAQDRADDGRDAPDGAERLLLLVNAPADGDASPLDAAALDTCREDALWRCETMGLRVTDPGTLRATTPSDFEALFPGTGGGLYGRAVHGLTGSFRRPGSRSRIPGLYLAGGGVHPGAGVPMVALSGRLAAAAVAGDLASTARSSRVATSGGTSTA
jgi:1-hydroxycarotenoid 3,4-desaturase